MNHKKLTMRNALLGVCITSVVFALLLQTFLFHQTLRRQIRAESISDNEISLNKMQEDIGAFIHNIRTEMLTIYSEQDLISDLRFLQELQPDMIGIGPYITHKDTPFCNHKSGPLDLSLRMVAILRLMFPYALIPSTTALGTIDPNGRELGLKAGANVVMPNLSPVKVRKLYELYENKICTGEEAAQCRGCLEARVKSAGYEIVTDIGNVKR